MTFCPPHSYELVTGPTLRAVSVNECKLAARVDTDEEDSVITSWIDEATLAVETDASMCLLTQTWRLNLDWFPSWEIPIRKMPVQSISSITNVATDGTTNTVSAADYIVDVTSFPPRVVPAYGLFWPTCRDQPRSVKVTFIAGATAATGVSETAKQAIRLHVAMRIREREGLNDEEYRTAFDRVVNRLRKFDMV
jgi:uncharacterized phiE125 gp8 family phage protein